MAKRLSLKEQVAAALKAFMKVKGVKVSTISMAVFRNGSRLTPVLTGEADMIASNWEATMQYLSDNWPEGAKWPDGVIRLEPAPVRKPRARAK